MAKNCLITSFYTIFLLSSDCSERAGSIDSNPLYSQSTENVLWEFGFVLSGSDHLNERCQDSAFSNCLPMEVDFGH